MTSPTPATTATPTDVAAAAARRQADRVAAIYRNQHLGRVNILRVKLRLIAEDHARDTADRGYRLAAIVRDAFDRHPLQPGQEPGPGTEGFDVAWAHLRRFGRLQADADRDYAARLATARAELDKVAASLVPAQPGCVDPSQPTEPTGLPLLALVRDSGAR